MTPASIIANLDAALNRSGQTVTLRRYTAPSGTPRPKIDVAGVKASVRTVKVDEIAGDITQTHQKAVLSPTGLGDLLPIVKGDKLVIGAKERNIDLVKPFVVGDVLVRIEILAGG